MSRPPVNGTSPTPWVKSSFSTTGEGCVQTRAAEHGSTEIGDTKDPDGPTITVPSTVWEGFLDQVQAGSRSFTGGLQADFLPDGGFILRDTATSTALTFTRAEWDAFYAGVTNGELRPLASL